MNKISTRMDLYQGCIQWLPRRPHPHSRLKRRQSTPPRYSLLAAMPRALISSTKRAEHRCSANFAAMMWHLCLFALPTGTGEDLLQRAYFIAGALRSARLSSCDVTDHHHQVNVLCRFSFQPGCNNQMIEIRHRNWAYLLRGEFDQFMPVIIA